MTGRPSYATGPGCVIHKTGARFGFSECEAIRTYLRRAFENPSWSIGNEGRQQDLADLEAAMRASFPEAQQKDVA